MTVAGGGVITVQLTSIGELGQASGDHFLYSPVNMGANLMWVVDADTSLPAKYLPRR